MLWPAFAHPDPLVVERAFLLEGREAPGQRGGPAEAESRWVAPASGNGGAYRVDEPGVADVRCASEGQAGFQGEPLLVPRIVECREPRPALVVPACELHVVQDGPDVRGVGLRQRGQPQRRALGGGVP